MKQKEFTKLSEVTEKKFPQGKVIGYSTWIELSRYINDVVSKNILDGLKKEIIYKDEKAATGVKLNPKEMELLHAAIGMYTEAVEILDLVFIKHIENGEELDTINLQEELGDSRWYEAIFIREENLEPQKYMKKVIRKLKARYGDKFSEFAATNRDLMIERAILEGESDK